MKVSVMGVELSKEEVEAIPEPTPALEAFFIEPSVSVKALDTASRIVPEDVWKPIGLHTWLKNRAAEVYRTMKVGETEKQLNRLVYFYEYVNDKPVLKNVRLAY